MTPASVLVSIIKILEDSTLDSDEMIDKISDTMDELE